MFVLGEFIMPWVRDEPITLRHILIGVPVWVLGGLAFGRTNQWIQQRIARKHPNERSTPS